MFVIKESSFTATAYPIIIMVVWDDSYVHDDMLELFVPCQSNMFRLKAPININDLVKQRTLSNVDDGWEKMARNFSVIMDGIPSHVSILETPEWFPLVSQIRFLVIPEDLTTRRRRKPPGVSHSTERWEVRLPNFAQDDVVFLSEALVQKMFQPSLIARWKSNTNHFYHVHYSNYNTKMGPYVKENEYGELDYWYEADGQMFYDGTSKFAFELKHVRFSSVKFLREEVEAAIRRGERSTDAGCATVVMVPNRPFWAVKIINYTTKRIEVRRVKQQWVKSRIMETTLQKVVTYSGQWHKLVKMDYISVYNRLLANNDLSPQETTLRNRELGLVIKAHAEEEDDETVEEQISHIMFRKKKPGVKKSIWEQLNIDHDYEYDCDGGYFLGCTFDNRDEAELLELSWVKDNFHDSFIGSVMKLAGVFWQVPVGHSRNTRSNTRKSIPMADLDTTIMDVQNVMDVPCRHKKKKLRLVPKVGRPLKLTNVEYPVLMEIDRTWPTIAFRQGDKQLCMFYSFASALSYMNLHRLAVMVRDQAGRSLRLETLIERTSLLESTLIKHRNDLFDTACRSMYNRGKLDVINNQQKAPTLAVLMSVDGAVNHAVTLFDNWVFDANEETALPISIPALNRVAPPGFKEVLIAFRYGKGKCDEYPKA